MFWQVRAVLEDRPGAMAALAGLCGENDINVLGLQIFPATGGQVVDEFVLRSPVGWSAECIERLLSVPGITVTSVEACSARVLEDQPVRYLRAAGAVMDEPSVLEEQLRSLLAAHSVEYDGAEDVLEYDAAEDVLVLDDETGPAVRLSRRSPFTDTEIARAAALHRIAVSVERKATEVLSAIEGPVADDAAVLRPGTADDADLVLAMHKRCSADTLHRRYHAPSPRASTRLVHDLLEPKDGWSVVVQAGEHVVGIGMVAGDVAEVGLLVEDGWQRRGWGARILDALVQEAKARGMAELTCLSQPDNRAVPRTIQRAGLRARASMVDGVVAYTIRVADQSAARSAERRARRQGGRRVASGKVTAPLVALLHDRKELREVYAVADFLDHAVRG